MTAPADHLRTLADLAHPEGGWGYVEGQPPHLEPTCLALLAIGGAGGGGSADERFRATVELGRAWLRSCAGPDGAYRLPRGRYEAVWPTALALFVEAHLGTDAGSLKEGAGVLLGVQGRALNNDEPEVNDVDQKLVGWPWAEGTFSWVEPTAWACLALRRLGLGEHPRVRQGLDLLRDRTLEAGGLNYGNRRIFGIDLEPIPTPTALALMALQGEQPGAEASVAYLVRHAQASDDLEHLGWAVLALDLYRDQPGVGEALDSLRRRIELAHAGRQEVSWVKAAPLRQALTALALNVGQRNPFRLPDGVAMIAPPAHATRPERRSLGERVRSAVQSLAVRALGQVRQTGPASAVHIAPATDYNADLAGVLSRQYEHFRATVPLKGKRVVLKPNLVEYHRDKVINTHPHFVAAVIELCRREGAAEVIVAEGPGHWRNVEYLVSASGLGDVLRHYQVPFVDLNHDEPSKQVNLGRLTGLSHLFLAKTIATAEVVISLPKLKTHHWAGATLALKNLFGTLPGTCYGWPKNELHWRGIHNSIVDIAATRTPDLAIVDGLVGMEGDGPLNGTPKATGVVVMGSDLVAVDSTCCRLMQLDPMKVGYLVLAQGKKLGHLEEGRVQQLGETISGRAQPFDTVATWQHAWTGRAASASA